MKLVMKSLWLAICLLAMGVQPALAWPDKPVTLVVPWAAGGTTDILARVMSKHLSTSLGQPVVVVNKPGASGNIGAGYVAKSIPDGYTLLFGTMSTHVINNSIMPDMPFDGVKDFSPIALLAYVTNTVVVNPSVPVADIPSLIAYAKAHPEKLAFASGGLGSTNHLSAALLEHATGIRMVHVPYKGGAQAITDLVAGNVDLFFTAATQSLPYIKSGQLRLLAVTESNRSTLFQSTPTVAETLPGYEMAVWYGAFGPSGMPRELVDRLNKEINNIMKLPEVRDQMAAMGVEVKTSTPEEFATRLDSDQEKYRTLIENLKITSN